MSSRFDQFAKDVLDLMLSAHGCLEREFEAPALKAQRADVMFDPDPSHDARRRELGLRAERRWIEVGGSHWVEKATART